MEYQDIVQEMMKIIWQSYRNGNRLAKVIEKRRIIPTWQLELIFLNALRNLHLDKRNSQLFEYFETGQPVTDQGNENADYLCPALDPLENQEMGVVDSMTAQEKQQWLRQIRKLKLAGYSDSQILELLKPEAELKRESLKADGDHIE